LLHQQSNRLERVEKNQEKISTVVTAQIEEDRRSKRRTLPLAIDNITSIPVDHQRGGKKPPVIWTEEAAVRLRTIPNDTSLRSTARGKILLHAKVVQKKGNTLPKRWHKSCQKDLSPGRQRNTLFPVLSQNRQSWRPMTALQIRTSTWNTWTLSSITTGRAAQLSASYSS
jgi:hypothetical protein